MKRFAVLLLALAMTVCCALPAFAAGTIEVTEDVSVSDDYDWTRFKGQNVAINVYNFPALRCSPLKTAATSHFSTIQKTTLLSCTSIFKLSMNL